MTATITTVRISALSAILAFSALLLLPVPAHAQLSCIMTINEGGSVGSNAYPAQTFVSEADCEEQARNAEGDALGTSAPDGDRCDCTSQSVDPGTGSAGGGGTSGPRKLEPRGLGNISLQVLAGRFANVLIGISGSVALLMFVYGGFLWLTSAGDSGKVDSGKKAMLWATIGLLVIFGSYAILSAIFAALQVGT